MGNLHKGDGADGTAGRGARGTGGPPVTPDTGGPPVSRDRPDTGGSACDAIQCCTDRARALGSSPRDVVMNAVRFLLWNLARFVVWLRYRVRVHGADKVRPLEGPILLLPNHPAFIDPVIVLTMTYPL